MKLHVQVAFSKPRNFFNEYLHMLLILGSLNFNYTKTLSTGDIGAMLANGKTICDNGPRSLLKNPPD